MKPAGPPPAPYREFSQLLCGKAEAKASGVLTAIRGRLRRIFCLEKGWLIYATSNLLEEQFLEYLVRTGAMSPNTRAFTVEMAAARRVGAAAILLESGRPPREVLRQGMEGLIAELATSTLEWPDGQFTFQDGRASLEDEITVRMSARSFVLAHARRHPAALDALRIRIGPPDLRPVATPVAQAKTEEMDALGAYLMGRCDGSADLNDLVKSAPAEEEATLRAIYGYLLAGLLEPEDQRVRRSRELRGEAEITREEAMGKIAHVGGQDHYGVLGIDRMARREAVRESYYGLARRFHPDRFRSGPLTDLLPRFEEYFTRVTEAYNTLWEPASRAEYDQQLASAATADTQSKTSDTAYLARQNFLRGRALAAQRKLTEAVSFLENAVKLDPGQVEFQLELGLVLAKNPRHRAAAERHLLQVIELSPAVVSAYIALAHLYAKAGRPGRAARMAKEAMRWDPVNLEASQILAEHGDATGEERESLRTAIFG
jgi:tetratricopeptide (TPR) repeat protein